MPQVAFSCVHLENFKMEVFFVDVQVSDQLLLKKTHPCGSQIWTVLRVGMDFKLQCQGCGHQVMIPRSKVEKSIKKVIKSSEK